MKNLIRWALAYFGITLFAGLILFTIGLKPISLIFVGLAVLYFASGLRKIPSTPLRFAIVEQLGRPTNDTRKAGWTWIITGYQSLRMEAATSRNIPVSTKNDATKDSVYFSSELRITWTPDFARPRNYILNFIKMGGDEEINRILKSALSAAIKHYINTHTSKQCLGSTDGAEDEILEKLTKLPAAEARRLLNDPDEFLFMEEMGIVIELLSAEDLYESDEKIRKARQAEKKETLQNKARVRREKGLNETEEIQEKSLSGLTPKERKRRTENRRDLRSSRNVEEGRGQEIRVTGGGPVIVNVPPKSGNGKRGKKKDRDDEGDDDS